MLDERARRHLAEMGIDTYVRRGAETPVASQPPRSEAPHQARSNASPNASRMQATVVVVPDSAEPEAAIIDDLRRALRMAGANAVFAGSIPPNQQGIVFEALSYETGTDAVNILVAGPVAALRGDAQRKRALWRGTAALLRRALQPAGADAERSG